MKARKIIRYTLIALNMAAVCTNIFEAITTESTFWRLISIVFACLGAFVVWLLVRHAPKKVANTAKNAPIFCESVIYWRHDGIRIETESKLEREREYYEEYCKQSK